MSLSRFPSSTSRRQFLATAASTSFFAMASRQSRGQSPASGYPGLIVRQSQPANLEFPFPSLDSFIIPTERFFVRSHFAVPRVDAATWSLDVGGAVDRPFRLSYDELTRMTARTLTVTFECAGNNRVDLVPRERGVLWGSGAVGNAEWTGVSLASLLERAGVRNTAVEVVLEGADEGTVNDEPRSPGPIRFARSLPLAKARQADVILAYRMNGGDLTPAHGAPVRVIVPGYYGVASVKWLTRIRVVEQPFQGYYQTFDYSYWDRSDGAPAIRPIGEMNVKSSIARPGLLETIPAGAPYRIHGAAWTGEGSITRVDISTDGGATWAAARLLGEAVPHAWRLWEFHWQNPQAGSHTIMARATDSRGRVQPLQRDTDRRNYMISHVLPVNVTVR